MNANETLLSSIVKHKEPASDSGVRITTFCLSGEPQAAALVSAVVKAYPSVTGRTPRPDLLALVGQKVSVLRHGEGMLGHSMVTLTPGTVFVGGRSGEPALLPKGSRKNGIVLRNVLDVTGGFDGKVLRDNVATVKARFPDLVRLTREHLTDLPGRGNTCRLAVLGTYSCGDGPIPGCLWLLHSYMRAEDIVEGVLLVPPWGSGVSEHGSVYGRDLLALRSVGAVSTPVNMTMREALDYTGRADGYFAALDRVRTGSA